MKTHFQKTLIASALLVGSLSFAPPESATANPQMKRTPNLSGATVRPQIKRAPSKSGAVVNSEILKGQTFPPMEMLVGAPIPLMTEMLNYAKIGRVGNGAKTAVYATVVITSAESRIKPGRSGVKYLHGMLSLMGNSGREYFAGNLDVANNFGGVATPFLANTSRDSSTRISIFRDGRVSMLSKFRGVNKKMESYTNSFTSDGSDGFLWGRDTSDGTTRLISVALAKSVFPLGGAQTAAPPSAPTAPAGPRGMRVRVTPSFKVMNSDDGMGFFKKDMTVELHGSLYLGSKKAWNRNWDNELSATKGNVIRGDSTEVEIFYDNPASWRLRVSGELEDSDMPSINSDIMWKGDENVDLKAAVEQQGGQVVMKGQSGDEYADLRLKVEKIADIN